MFHRTCFCYLAAMSAVAYNYHLKLAAKFCTSARLRVAVVINGRAMAKQLKDELRNEVKQWVSEGHRPPRLTAILVGTSAPSDTYVRNKMKAADYIGMTSEMLHLPATVSENELLNHIYRLNADDAVDGILIQLPVPSHINERRVCNAVAPHKDVDGFHTANIGRVCVDQRALVPATPAAVLEIIKRAGIGTLGKNAVVCGRSKNVGLPIALLLHADGAGETEACDATTTICHRYTPHDQLLLFTRNADILVVATGIPGLITADMVKEDAVVIDVGFNEIHDSETGKWRVIGDVDFSGVIQKAAYITPVPGGVGPVTIAMLMKNTLLAARHDITYDNGDR